MWQSRHQVGILDSQRAERGWALLPVLFALLAREKQLGRFPPCLQGPPQALTEPTQLSFFWFSHKLILWPVAGRVAERLHFTLSGGCALV